MLYCYAETSKIISLQCRKLLAVPLVDNFDQYFLAIDELKLSVFRETAWVITV
jgi:hypothetical protein